jgi:hypothetical protein
MTQVVNETITFSLEFNDEGNIITDYFYLTVVAEFNPNYVVTNSGPP